MASTNRAFYAQKFETEYQRLNDHQKVAVDTIYGPLLVVAGPGTGKTQMLALRVCRILNETDLDAGNILCLTFTEAGTVAMRNRLVSFMGPDAYKVGIFTFHGFCNKIIRENPEYFGDYFNLQNADEVELYEIVEAMVAQLPLDHPLKRNTGNRNYDIDRFIKVFGAMKQEEWTPEEIENAYDEYAALLPTLEDFQYKSNYKGNKKGDPKTESIKTELKKFEFVRNASKLLATYQELLRKKDRIDFNDSITWVVKALKNHGELRLRYQEQFQFVLADEYQDTNNAQNDILFMLGDYDDQPNLFVVGDDDQAIYRFQGANLHNINRFIEKFNPGIVVLDVNYRSRQEILDTAKMLIENNRERLTHKIPGLNKNLKAGQIFEDNSTPKPELKLYKNPGSMELGLVRQIKDLHDKGVPYNEIAIIYRNHKDADALIQYYTKLGIPVNVKKRVDVLQQPEIKRIIQLLAFIQGELAYPDSQRHILFEILHYDFWGLKPLEIGRIAIHASRMSREETDTAFLWRSFLSDENALQGIGITETAAFVHCAHVLENLIAAVSNHTAQVILEKVITETGMMDQVLRSGNASWRLQLINRFFDFVKDLTAKDGDMNLAGILDAIEKRKEFGIDLPYNSILVSEEGIHFVTAHGSKGLEFSHVFILNASKKSWLEKPGDKVKFPPTLFRKAGDSNDEDERRLFYVAMTRAKQQLVMLAPMEDQNGKSVESLPFLAELGFDITSMPIENSDADELAHFLSTSIREVKLTPALIDGQAIDAALAKLEMNATGVSKFLHCPVTFYFENILRVPSARKPAPGYGNAVHYALEKYFQYWNDVKSDAVPPVEIMINFFYQGMEKYRSHFTNAEFESHQYEGKLALQNHFELHSPSWNLARQHRVELKIKADYEGIPITGIIDRLSQYDDHYEVYDYKTGKFDSGKFTKAADLEPGSGKEGGDYWRQAVFYRLLTEKQREGKGRFGTATFQFMSSQKEDAKVKAVEVHPEDMEKVGQQIQYVYQKIVAHDFDNACQECEWCMFVAEQLATDSIEPDFSEEDREYPEIEAES